jgi:hypothetical protein
MFYVREANRELVKYAEGCSFAKDILTSSALLVFNSSQFYPQIPTFRFHIDNLSWP